MKFIVSVAIDARIDVPVEANNFEEAREKAQFEVMDVNFNNAECIELTPVNAEDENGVFIDY